MNSIHSLSSGAVDALTKSASALLENSSESKESFADILTDAYGAAQSTDSVDKGSALDLLTGNVDDLSTVLIDSEKAKVALSLTIQLRNKVVEAYNQIMNMQV